MRASVAALSGLLVFPFFPFAAGVDVWTGNGPSPGSVDMVAFLRGSPRTLLARDRARRILRSTDLGATWASTVLTSSASSYQGVPFVPALQPGTAYLPAGNLYKTTDSGASWVDLGLAARAVTGDPSGSPIYAAADTYVFRSTDGGATWSRSSELVGLRAHSLAIDPDHPNVMYGTGRRSIFQQAIFSSTDAGGTWSFVPLEGVSCAITAGYFTAYVGSPPKRIYAGLGCGMPFESTDGGATWAPVRTTFGLSAGTFASASLDASRLLLGTNSGLFLSTDSGQTWTAAPEMGSARVPSVFADPDDASSFYAGSYAGAYRSTDAGASWTQYEAAPIADVWSVAGDPRSPVTFYAGTAGNVFKTTDGGSSWRELRGFPPDFVNSMLAVAAAPWTLLAATNHGLRSSTDGGTSWRLVPGFTAPSGWGPVEPAVSVLASNASSPRIVYATVKSLVYRSTDAGTTWIRPSDEFLPPWIGALTVDLTNPDVVYAAAGGNLFRSTDAAVSWTNTSLSWPAFTGSATAVALDPRDPIVYIGTEDSLLRSTDSGVTWGDVSAGIPSPRYINRIIADRNSGRVFAASDSGTFVSGDHGDSWTAFGYLPEGAIAQSFTQSPSDPSRLLCGTISHGALTLTISDYPIAHGDANADGTVDVLDVFALLDFLFAGGAPPGGISDANGDGTIDVADVFYLINHLFAGGPAPV